MSSAFHRFQSSEYPFSVVGMWGAYDNIMPGCIEITIRCIGIMSISEKVLARVGGHGDEI
jgi:hypothetical protein